MTKAARWTPNVCCRRRSPRSPRATAVDQRHPHRSVLIRLLANLAVDEHLATSRFHSGDGRGVAAGVLRRDVPDVHALADDLHRGRVVGIVGLPQQGNSRLPLPTWASASCRYTVPDTWSGSRSPTGATHWAAPSLRRGGARRGDGATLAPASASNAKTGRRRLNKPIRAVKQPQRPVFDQESLAKYCRGPFAGHARGRRTGRGACRLTTSPRILSP